MNLLLPRICAALALTASSAYAQNAFIHWESPHVSPIALSPDGTRLVAVNTADHRIEIYAVGANGLPQWQASVPVGLDPVSVRLRSNSEAWVVNHLSDSLSIVDLGTRQVVKTISTGDEPADVVFAGTPQRAFVTLSSRQQLQVFDAAAPAAALNTLTLDGREPRALAVSPDGYRVYVAMFESGNGSTALPIPAVNNPNGPYAGQNPPPNSGNQYSPSINPALPAPPRVAQIVRKDGAGVWRDDNGRDWSQFVTWNIADNDVAIVNTSTLSISYVPRMMTMVMALGVAPDGRLLAVGTELKNEIRFEPNVKSIFVRTQIGSFAQATPSSVSLADLNPQLDYQSRTVPVEVRAQALGDPRGIAIHPANGEVYVSGMGSNNVVISNSSGTRLGRINVGAGPTGLALNADGSKLYVLNKFDATISTIDTAQRSELGRVDFYDPTPAVVKDGRPLLYNTTSTSGLGQAACASCHVDARLDGLAWDLGDPSGEEKAVNQPCRPNQICDSWSPMKGPMVTQSLQGIVGNGAMHWRGDKENVAAFAPAFTGLQGADAEPDAAQMQKLEDFIASVRYQPNPNRNPDGSMPTTMAVTGGNGNPTTGLAIYQNFPVLPGGATCNSCHTLPVGTSGEIDNPAAAPQPLKTTQLRGMWEKVGLSFTSQNNSRGFGFMSDGHHDTLAARLGPPFDFGAPAQAPQRRRDVEAFLLAFETETPAAVGRTLAYDGSNNSDPNALSLLNSLISQANTGSIALIARRYDNGSARGFVYATQGIWLSDRENVPTTADALRTGASAVAPVTFIAVPINAQFRMGVDRDADGYFDQDEADQGSNPADAASIPANFCRADFDASGLLDASDLSAFTAAHGAGNPRTNWDRSFNASGLPTITAADLAAYQSAYAAGCGALADPVYANGFE